MLLRLALLCVLATHARAAETVVKLCHDDVDNHPWTFKDKPGLNDILLRQAGRDSGVRFEFQVLPWPRCLAAVKANQLDGLFAASFKPERLEIGVFPMLGNQADPARAMYVDGYTLFRLKGSTVNWDGKTFSGVNGRIGAQSGYSIVDQLLAAGVKVDDSARPPADNLRKLLAGRVVAVALPTLTGRNQVEDEPEFAQRIEAISPPLVAKPYHLLFSRAFYQRNTALADKLWQAVGNARESAEYKKQERQFR